jgi:hypothetical protein
VPFSLRNAALNVGFVLLRARCIVSAAFVPGGIAEPAGGGNVFLRVFAAILSGMQMLCGTLAKCKQLAGQLVLQGKRCLIEDLPHGQVAVKAATVLRGVGVLAKSLEFGHGSRKDAYRSR